MIVATPTSVTDPYDPEPTNTAPVLVRLLHTDGTTTDRREGVSATKNVLAMPLFFCGGRLYIRRGTDGVRHLFREVPEIPRLDAAMTDGERSVLQSALTLVQMAQARMATARTVTGETALAGVAEELARWLAG